MISLAQILQNDFDCTFVSHEAEPFLLDELKSAKIPFQKVKTIHYNSPDLKGKEEEVPFDMDEMLDGDEIVVVDGYWFGRDYQYEIKRKGSFVVCIDDQAEREFT